MIAGGTVSAANASPHSNSIAPTPAPSPEEFTIQIFPGSPGGYSALGRQVGLSRYYKLTVTGVNVPHPMHWDAFRLVE